MAIHKCEMTKSNLVLAVVFSLLFATPSWAYKPLPCFSGRLASDVIEYEGDTSSFRLANGNSLPMPGNVKLPESKVEEECRGLSPPRAQWHIENERLWFDGFQQFDGTVILEKISDDGKGPILADWFSGEISIERGRILCRSIGNDRYLWDTTMSLQIEKGEVRSITERRLVNDPRVPTKEDSRRLRQSDEIFCLSPEQQKELRDTPSSEFKQDRQVYADGRYPYSPDSLWKRLVPVLKMPPSAMTFKVFDKLLGLEEFPARVSWRDVNLPDEMFSATKGGRLVAQVFPFGRLVLNIKPENSGGDTLRTMKLYLDLFGVIVGRDRLIEESEKYCVRPDFRDVEAQDYRHVMIRDVELKSMGVRENAPALSYREEVFVDDEQSAKEVYKTLELGILPNGCLRSVSLETLFQI